MQEGPSVAANTLQSIGSPDLRIICMLSFFQSALFSWLHVSFTVFFPSPAADTVEWKPAFDVWDPIMLSSKNLHACYL